MLFICIMVSISMFSRIHANKKISIIGIEYLIHQYLIKSFQKVSLLLLKSKHTKTNVSQEEVTQKENLFIQETKSSILEKLLYFVRSEDILNSININLSKTDYSQINLFLLPDVIIKDNQYYHHLLLHTSSIFSEKIIDLDNEQSKLFLAQL